MTTLKMTSTGLGIAAAVLLVAASGTSAQKHQTAQRQTATQHVQAAAQKGEAATIQGGTTQPPKIKGRYDRPTKQQEEKELRALVPTIVSSWDSMDIEKIGRYYASDADFAYFDIAPMKYNNWAEYREGVQKGLFDQNRSLKTKVNDDAQVHVSGTIAWATFTFGADLVGKQGASSHVDGRWTMVLEKRVPGWIVVHEHVSVPLAGM